MTTPTKTEMQAVQAADQWVKLLLGSKDQRKRFGNPGNVRETVRERILATALRAAIAEEIFAHPKLYGHDMVAAYVKRCQEFLK